MNSLNTLYFPGTDIYSIRQYPIFLLFQTIHLIRPVEGDPEGSGKECSDSFIKSGFCQVHTPCPLGEKRDRFLHLVQDIRNRKDDYASQLSSLILASKSGTATIDEDSEQAITRSLLFPGEQQTTRRQSEKEEKLWQARLVLAIGEILDEEEEEIARNLAMLDDDQAELFKELRGEDEAIEDDSPFAELSQLESKLNAGNTGNIKKRFNGWKTLFLEGNLPECEIFLTTSQDAGDLLLNLYENRSGLSAPLLAELELPGLIGWTGAEALEAAAGFHGKYKELLTRLHAALADFTRQEEHEESQDLNTSGLAVISKEWQAQLETVFPVKLNGRIPVRYYLFPGLACSTLIGKSQPAAAGSKNGLLVVVD